MTDLDLDALGPVVGFHTQAADSALDVRVDCGNGHAVVLHAEMGEPLALITRAPSGRVTVRDGGVVTIRGATDDEQREAVLRAIQQRVLDGEASHDCGEWRHGMLCGVCGRRLG